MEQSAGQAGAERGGVAPRPGGAVRNRVARTDGSRRAVVGPAVQMRLATNLTDEEYVSERAWNAVSAPPCPWCKPGTCELAPHGFYVRVKPRGALIRRCICRTTEWTVSLLPDCFAAWIKGSLEEQEQAVRVAEGAATQTEAVERVRPPGECNLASAQRWLQRRMQWVGVLLVTVKGLYPERFTGVAPTLAGCGQQLGSETVLRTLREVAAAHLRELPAPVGFHRMRVGVRTGGLDPKKHATGLSPPPGTG